MYAAAIHRPSLITPSPEDARPSCPDRALARELSPCLQCGVKVGPETVVSGLPAPLTRAPKAERPSRACDG
jgi:hypothetical protein